LSESFGAGTGASQKIGRLQFYEESDALFGSIILSSTVTATPKENIDTMDANGVALGRGSVGLLEPADGLGASGFSRRSSSAWLFEAAGVGWMVGRALPAKPPVHLGLSIKPPAMFGVLFDRRERDLALSFGVALAPIGIRIEKLDSPMSRMEAARSLSFVILKRAG
jgi:hypothetical protein